MRGRGSGGVAACVTSALILFATTVARAAPDRVEFHNGSSLEGEVVSESDSEVALRSDGGIVTFPRSLVARIVRGEPASAGHDGVGGAKVGGATATPPAEGVLAVPEEWQILWSGERRVGWRRCLRRDDAAAVVLEEETAFLSPEGAVEVRTRVLEEASLDLRPRRFTYREDAGTGFTEVRGRVEGSELVLEETVDGKERVRRLATPPGFRLPFAARAFVLREGESLPGGWKGTVYDPRAGRFEEQTLRIIGRERVPWEGAVVDVVVLLRTRDGLREEERVARRGTVLTAELNGPSLTAVGTSRERAEAVGAGKALDPSADELRARTTYVSEADGFRLRKPGIAWEFEEGRQGSNPRVRIRDVGGLVFVEVSVEAADADRSLAAAAAALEGRFRAGSAEFSRLEDGFDRFAGEPAYRLLCDARVKGDRVRTLARVVLRGGKVWTLTGSCPVSAWEEVRPHLERILDGFEWI